MRKSMTGWMVAALILGFWSLQWLSAQQASAPAIEGWKPGVGWGWIWGAEDEVGALNAMTPQSVRAAVGLVREGKIYDLGVPYDRSSYKWPGHSPGEVMTFRAPEGVKRQKDIPVHDNAAGTAWHSCALFVNDNVATHATTGADDHWYNGFKEADWGGNFGIRKCDAVTIPPVVTRGVLLDVAGFKGVGALEPHYSITVDDVKGTLRKQGVSLQPGDTVLVRTGTLSFWGESGADHEKIDKHDKAGMSIEATRFLIEQHGAIMVGSDTSGYESWPAPEGSRSFMPAHDYLLIEQGVHIGEFHYLEDLARDKVYEFCYVALTNKIRGTTAGFCMRPIAMR